MASSDHVGAYRDIKTNNLLLGHDGLLRLTDFGLSREYYLSENQEKKRNKVGLSLFHTHK